MNKSLYDEFIAFCVEDCINSLKTCPRCQVNMIEQDMTHCADCEETLNRREFVNDSGI